MAAPGLVSVILATHNYAHYLPDAIRSVQAQTYSDWECIIVDDASTDDTPQIAQALIAEDRRIRYIRNSQNLGVSRSRNAGHAAAKGRWIAVLDADDWWHPQKLTLQMNALAAQSESVFCFSDYIVVSSQGEKVVSLEQNWVNDLPRSLRAANRILHTSVVMLKDAVDVLGGYDPGLPSAHDWDLYLRMLDRYGVQSFVHVPRELAHYRIHDKSITHNLLQMRKDEWLVLLRHGLGCGWCLRHPWATLGALDEQLKRDAYSSSRAGRRGRALSMAYARILLGPWRRWRWSWARACGRNELALAACTFPTGWMRG